MADRSARSAAWGPVASIAFVPGAASVRLHPLVAAGVSGTTVRAVLTGVVVLLAVVVGRGLSHRAGHIPVRVEGLRGGIKETSGGMSPWLGRVTLFSTWIAAAAAIAIIWLAGTGKRSLNANALLTNGLIFAEQLGGSLIVVAVTLSLGRLLERAFVAGVDHRALNPNLERLGAHTVYAGTLVIGAIAVLSIWTSGVVLPVTLVGAMTVALTLSLQDILRNLVAGVYLLIEGRFAIGDQITTNAVSGQVEDIQLRVTLLRTTDGDRVLVPNAMIFSSVVVNQTAFSEHRVIMNVTTPATADAAVRTIAQQLVRSVSTVAGVCELPPPDVTLSGVADNKLTLRLAFWVASASVAHEATIRAEVIEQLRRDIKDAAIEIGQSVTVG